MRSTLIFTIYFLMLVLSGLVCVPAKAIEISDLKFKEVGKPEGLSDSAVLDIVEDDKGYIWIATANGLNRYSGYNVKQYHPSDTNSNSIPSGYIYKLLFDSQQNLWVATHSGLARYRPESDDFEVFDKENSVLKADIITGISESSEGDILFTDPKNLYRYSISNQRIELIKKVFDVPSRTGVIRDETNRIWIGSKGSGISILDKHSNKLYHTTKVNPWGVSLDISTLNAMQVIEGNYWLATNNGIQVVSASGQIIKHIADDVFNNASKLQIKAIKEIDGNIWVGTGQGTFILKKVLGKEINPRTKIEFIYLDQASQETTMLPLADVTNIFVDRMNVVWLGSLKKGTYKFHPAYAKSKYKPVFNSDKNLDNDHSAIWGFSEDSENRIYLVSQQRGIGLIQTDTSDVVFFDVFEKLPADITYWDLEIDDDGYFWLASSNGIYLLQLFNDELQIIDHIFEGNFIDFLYLEGNDVWLWSENNGTIKLNRSGDEVSLSSIEKASVAERLIPIFKDSYNRLWLRKDDGLKIFDLGKKKTIKEFSSSDGINFMAYSIYETSEALWITTRSNGIVMVDKNSLEVRKIQKRPEGASQIISSVGVNDSIWYVDSAGVHQLSLPDLVETLLIPNSELNYNSLGESSVFSSFKGYIYFGGMEGYNRVNNNQLGQRKLDSETLSPEIEEFRVFGSQESYLQGDVQFHKRVDVQNNASHTADFGEMINLDYDESRFSVAFYLLNAIYPRQTIYRYRLQGFDENWTYTNIERTAQFNNIKFGSYVFEVQAKEPQKSWSTSKLLNINVARPPWLHTVALVFYCIIALAFLAFIVRQYQIRNASQLAIKESEERLKLTLWSSGDELWDWDVYRGQVYRANTWGTLDFPQDDIRTTGAYDANIHPNDITRVKDSLREHLEGKSDFYELAYRAKTFNNQWIWILDRGKVVERDHNEQPVRMTGTLKNIHHLKEAEEQLNLFKRSIENISEGVFITNTQFKFISVNNAYCGYTGETRDQALASYMHFHLYPDAFTEEIKKTLKSKGNWSGEVESVRVNGERYEMELNIDAVHDEDGKISHFVGVFSDITSRKNTEKELLKLANTDPLTELPNRSFFQASHQNLVRKGAQHTLLCLDMDNFKKINDSLGHQTGDILIKQIAKRLQRTTGKSATCYRLGGDEFSILMDDNADVHTVTHYAQSLLDTLSRPFIINKQEFVLGASIGIAFYPDDGNSPQEMLKNADTAMYFAKNNGGNSYQFFSGEMNQNAVRQLQIENLIRQGIKEDLFTVYYQPKVDIATGKLVSMEALVRFEHPQKGIVSPGQFIPLAEQTGQIIEIGEQVLRKACADTKRWVSQGLFSGRVAVNISAKQFELPDLDDRINRILSDVGLSPLHLECEITEGTLMESPENGLQMMNRLRERGIHLALDDFGTGYSSLAYLKRFPLNTLKIDKAFIDDIAVSNVDRHMAAAIINIAHNLGLKVVAEGVEEEAQLDILRRYDCEMLQGFLYSRPLNAERFEKLLTENQQLHTILSQSSV